MYMISVFILIEMRELRLSNVIKNSSKVFETSTDGIYITDAQGFIEQVNSALASSNL